MHHRVIIFLIVMSFNDGSHIYMTMTKEIKGICACMSISNKFKLDSDLYTINAMSVGIFKDELESKESLIIVMGSWWGKWGRVEGVNHMVDFF